MQESKVLQVFGCEYQVLAERTIHNVHFERRLPIDDETLQHLAICLTLTRSSIHVEQMSPRNGKLVQR